MLLIYTHKITPRLTFVCKQLFVRIIGIPVSFTTEVSEFISHNGPKLTYSKNPLGNELFVKSNELLFEQGVNDVEIQMQQWGELPVFFYNNSKGQVPFDIFAASFYLLSRYEEYVPHVQDNHGRFSVYESLAFEKGFLQKPLVDCWALKLKEIILERFDGLVIPDKTYNEISTIDVDNVFAYKEKGIIRNLGGFVRDFFKFRIENIIERILVLLRLRKDPFDTYDEILKISKENNVKTIFFFLIGDYTTYDTNVSSSNNVFRSLIKSVADYVDVGLHPSYFTMHNNAKMIKEKRKMEQILNRPVLKTRQHYLRLKLPDTYQNLTELEVEEDHSMGYAKEFGFRASTCTPFYFYDLDFEIQTPLKIFPFAVMDTTLNDHLELVPVVAKSKIEQVRREVQKVNGTFITLFHNETLSDKGRWKGWGGLYKSIYSKAEK
ncbi:MAG: polysaccharide deacetylase family protein [Flavobacteriaceae bacterium]|nr:polysaccharide deacetylase family protein [Flavobacteriaceae bacterium]